MKSFSTSKRDIPRFLTQRPVDGPIEVYSGDAVGVR